MSIYSSIRNWPLITKLRDQIPHSWVNTFWHLPLAIAANLYYGFPGRKLKVIGVTGTKGKTTTVTGIYHCLKTAGKKVAMISTVEALIGQEKIDTGFHVTSPDPWLLQKLIQKTVRQQCEYLVLESTSHGLAQHRLWGIRFDVGVLTNIQPEHLDYHQTMFAYTQAKAKLFNSVKVAVLNREDDSYETMFNHLKRHNYDAEIIAYGIKNNASVFQSGIGEITSISARSLKSTPKGSRFVCKLSTDKYLQYPKSFPINLNLQAKYNVYNGLAVLGAALSLEIKVKTIQKALASFPQISGHMEIIEHQRRKIVIDFAHTPDSIAQVLSYLASGLSKNKKLIAVFGSAGLRDHIKRPKMGETAARYADIIILTAEDPRTEDVNQIIDQIAQGCLTAGAKEIKSPQGKGLPRQGKPVFLRQADRQRAINLAIKLSRSGDTIAVLGKGHEKSMCFGTTETPWSDQEAVKKAILVAKKTHSS